MNNLALITRSLPFQNRSFLFRNLCLAASFLFLIPVAYGANRYWVAPATANWNNPLNWSTASGGAGGAGVPGPADRVNFDNGGPGNCLIDIPISITRIDVLASYPGTISQGANTITISGVANFGGGIFAGGSADITITGNFANSGTAFTSTSGTLEFNNNVDLTGGTFSHHNGSVRLNSVSGTLPLNGNSPVFYNLELVGNANIYNFLTGGDVTVIHALNITGTSYCRINGSAIDVTGDINISNTATGGGGNGQINVNGTGTQFINGGTAPGLGLLPQFSINSTGTVNLTGIVSFAIGFTYTSGTVNPGSSTVCFTNTGANSYDISGVLSLNNVIFLTGGSSLKRNFPAGSVLTVTGTLTMDGSDNLILNTPVDGSTAIVAKGDIVDNNSGSTSNGNAGILINGSGNQSFSGTVPAGSGILPYISIQKLSGTLLLGGTISVGRDWTYASGVVDAVSNAATVVFGGNPLNVASNGMSFYNFTVAANTVSLTNNLTVLGDLTLTGGNLKPDVNTINLAGNWNNSGGTFTEATSTLNLNGSALQTLTSASTEAFYNLAVNNSGTGIRLMNALSVRNTLSMNQGNIDLNGNGITLGTSVANRGVLVQVSGSMINAGSFTRWFNSSTIADRSVSGLFPTGTATDYQPFYVSAPVTKPTNGGTITVSYTASVNNSTVSFLDGASTVSIRKDLHWSVSTGNALAGGSYNLSAGGAGFGQIGNVNDLRITLAGSVVGTAGANAGSTSDPQVNRTGLTITNLANSFYIGSVSPLITTLPVTLVSFTATILNEEVKLDWVTSAETDNNYFIIERSANTKSWEDMARVNAVKNGDNGSHYTHYDENPLTGTSWYRLKQTDIDGRETFSETRKIERNEPSGIKIFPNPATDYITVSVPGAPITNIELVSTGGRKMNAPVHYQGGSATLFLSGISSGIYMIRISQGTRVQTRKLLIRK